MRRHGAVFSAAMASVFTGLLMTRAADIRTQTRPREVSWRLDGGPPELAVLVLPGTTASMVLPGEALGSAGPGRRHWTGAAGN